MVRGSRGSGWPWRGCGRGSPSWSPCLLWSRSAPRSCAEIKRDQARRTRGAESRSGRRSGGDRAEIGRRSPAREAPLVVVLALERVRALHGAHLRVGELIGHVLEALESIDLIRASAEACQLWGGGRRTSAATPSLQDARAALWSRRGQATAEDAQEAQEAQEASRLVLPLTEAWQRGRWVVEPGGAACPTSCSASARVSFCSPWNWSS